MWGLPAAAAALKMPLAVDHSQIAASYALVGSLAAALAVLLVAAVVEALKRRRAAIVVAVLAAVVAFASMFGFLYVRGYHLDRQFEGRGTSQSAVAGERTQRSKSEGVVRMRHFSHGNDETPVREEQLGDPADIIALTLFSLAFGGFAVVFSTMAVCREAPIR
jgi:hypothetical protein